MKKKLKVVLVILITILCIMQGFRVRRKNAIRVESINVAGKNSISYLLETSQNHIIMIDGGSKEDAEHLQEVLQEKGGVIEAWFITRASSQNFGALEKIMENDQIEIHQIYTSFNSEEWYEKNVPEDYPEMSHFFEIMKGEKWANKVVEVPEKLKVVFDNLQIRVLNIKNPELTGEYAKWNQSMVLRVSNTYKSMIFMGNIAQEAAKKCRDNNRDVWNCDAVQVSFNQEQNVEDEIYQEMTPEYIFIPTSKNTEQVEIEDYSQKLKELLNVPEVQDASKSENVIEIW